jgi:hypothetical protein
MANWGMGCGPHGSWFEKPSYLGLWVASNPWGPWTQIHEEAAWTPEGDHGARCYQPQIAPKWIAEDGKSFWLVWTDFAGYEQLFERLAQIEDQSSMGEFFKDKGVIALRPYYAFNAQRVDLVSL